MTCARRLAGARTPASSTSAGPRRPDARAGRARTRLSLLPVLALLLGAFGLFAATPAQAQTKPVLTGLSLSVGGNTVALTPGFASTTESYTASVPTDTTSLTLTPTWSESGLVFVGIEQR